MDRKHIKQCQSGQNLTKLKKVTPFSFLFSFFFFFFRFDLFYLFCFYIFFTMALCAVPTAFAMIKKPGQKALS